MCQRVQAGWDKQEGALPTVRASAGSKKNSSRLDYFCLSNHTSMRLPADMRNWPQCLAEAFPLTRWLGGGGDVDGVGFGVCVTQNCKQVKQVGQAQVQSHETGSGAAPAWPIRAQTQAGHAYFCGTANLWAFCAKQEGQELRLQRASPSSNSSNNSVFFLTAFRQFHLIMSVGGQTSYVWQLIPHLLALCKSSQLTLHHISLACVVPDTALYCNLYKNTQRYRLNSGFSGCRILSKLKNESWLLYLHLFT